MPNPEIFQRGVDRIKFPSETHFDSSFHREMNALAYTDGLVLSADIAAALAKANGLITADQFEPISEAAIPALVLSFVGVGLSIAGAVYEEYVAFHNRMPFGEFLTVSKVAMTCNYFALNALPDLRDQRFVGELHFLGLHFNKAQMDRDVTWKRSPLEIARGGLTGLYSLAEACERNDKSLRDINYFVGISHIVTKGLQRFGFQVSPDTRERSLADSLNVARFIGKMSDGSPESDKEGSKRQNMICIVGRDNLVANKATIGRFSQMLQNAQ